MGVFAYKILKALGFRDRKRKMDGAERGQHTDKWLLLAYGFAVISKKALYGLRRWRFQLTNKDNKSNY